MAVKQMSDAEKQKLADSEREKLAQRQRSSPIKNFIAGGVGGVFTIVTGQPLDTIKVRIQTMPKPAAGALPLYAGTWDCARKTVTKEGFLGLYKGMGAPLVGIAPVFAISFFGNSVGKRLQQSDPNQILTLPQLYLAGAFSGIFTTTIMTPGERIKCLLQIQQGGTAPPKYKGPMDCFKQLYREGGIRSIYKGTGATLLRDVPASGMYFASYEATMRYFTPPGSTDKISFGLTMFAGATAGVMNWVVGMPADVLKSRLQTAPEGTYPNGIRSVFKQLMKEEGPLALYKGFTPVMLRAVPANAACFMGFELAMKTLNWAAPNL